MQQYASKALSEAKVNLSWINPDPEYVKAVQGFLEDILIPQWAAEGDALCRIAWLTAASTQSFRSIEFPFAIAVENCIAGSARFLSRQRAMGIDAG